MSLKVTMFPGQGSQFQGMGEDLFKEFPKTVEIAGEVLGYDVADLCLTNKDNLLNQTNYTQPAMFLVNYLYYQKYLKANKVPYYLLGHSLGEFNALNAAGVFDFETGLKIVQKRGELMFSIEGTTMAAVIGADYKEIKEILHNHFPDIDIANVNTPSQMVISGPTDSLEKAADYFEEEGLVYIPLKVSGAFHSRYMAPIKSKFQQFIEGMKLNKCMVPGISNFSAAPYPTEKEGIIKNMVNQIDSRVKWMQSVEYVMFQGDCDFVEVGPGEVLTNVIKKIKN
jgi:trans-AT polyketide synthase/acyltransferase/oxidoreductase domain-containing protein